ncbi:MAG: molybdenum cofactor biosynthesis protein MoaE [Deltaproteobacteria bacterium]|nr:molybdenum cofactor biosynthesis protein MoaE [Deltaproteobacteria bacterium]
MNKNSREGSHIDLNALIDRVKSRRDYSKVGMILTHLGIVRGSSRDGKEVVGMRVELDRDRLESIIAEQKKRPGIVDILVEVREGDLSVGDDVLAIVVAGDVRENVIQVLSDALNAVKAQATKKLEHFK